MKGHLTMAIAVCLLALSLTAAPIWAVDPPGRRGAFVDPDEPFMTDRVLDEDLERMPGFERDFDNDFDHDFDRDFDDDNPAGEVRQQLRRDIPELTEEPDSRKER